MIMLEKVKYGFYSVLVLLNTAMISFAQNTEHKVDVDIDVKGAQWYNQWWIWAVVAMLFILLIVAMLSRGRSEAG